MISKVEKKVQEIEFGLPENIRQIQRMYIPYVSDMDLRERTSYKYKENTYKDASKKIFLTYNLPIKSNINNKMPVFSKTLQEAVDDNLIHPFILFINNRAVKWSDLSIVMDYKRSYIIINNYSTSLYGEITSIIHAKIIKIPYRVRYGEDNIVNENYTGNFYFDAQGLFTTKVSDIAMRCEIITSCLNCDSSVLGVRYIRDYINGSTSNIYNHWVEIKAFDKMNTNVAYNKIVTINDAILANTNIIVDNNATNLYDGGNGLQYATIDLGDLYNLDNVTVWHFYNDGRTYHKTKTQVSRDGVNWITLFDSAISGEYKEVEAGHVMKLDSIKYNGYIQIDTDDDSKLSSIDNIISFKNGKLSDESTHLINNGFNMFTHDKDTTGVIFKSFYYTGGNSSIDNLYKLDNDIIKNNIINNTPTAYMDKLKEGLNLDISANNKFDPLGITIDNARIISITKDKFLMCYSNSEFYGIICIVEYIDGVLTKRTEYTFSGINVFNISIVNTENNSIFLLCYRDWSVNKIRTVTISGEYLILGVPKEVPNTILSICKLDNCDKFVAIVDSAAGTAAQLISLYNNYSSMDLSTAYVFNSGSISQICMNAINSNSIFVCYKDNYGSANVITIDKVGINISDKYIFETNDIWNINCEKISDIKMLISFSDNTSQNQVAQILYVKGNAISAKSQYIFSYNYSYYLKSCMLNGSIIVFFDDNKYNFVYGIININDDKILYEYGGIINNTNIYSLCISSVYDKICMIISDSSDFHGYIYNIKNSYNELNMKIERIMSYNPELLETVYDGLMPFDTATYTGQEINDKKDTDGFVTMPRRRYNNIFCHVIIFVNGELYVDHNMITYINDKFKVFIGTSILNTDSVEILFIKGANNTTGNITINSKNVPIKLNSDFNEDNISLFSTDSEIITKDGIDIVIPKSNNNKNMNFSIYGNTVQTTSVEVKNKVMNSSFIDGLDKWTLSSDIAFTLMGPDQDKPASWVVKSPSITGLNSDNIRSIVSNKIPAKIGDTVIFSVEFKVDDATKWDRRYPFIYQEHNNSNTRVAFTDVIYTGEVISNKWYRVVYGTTVSNAGTTYIDIRLSLFRNGCISFRNPQIAFETVDSGYSSYIPNTPSMDYPSTPYTNINTKVVLDKGKRNWFKNSDFKNGTNNWFGSNGSTVVTLSDSPDGKELPDDASYCIKNTMVIDSIGYTFQNVSLIPNTIYTASAWLYNPSGINNVHIGAWYGSVWISLGNCVGSAEKGKWVKVSFTFTSCPDSRNTIIGFGSYGNIGDITYCCLPKVELGDTVTPWVPAITDPSFSAKSVLIPYELRSVGSVRDEITKDGEYFIQKVGKSILDGTKNYSTINILENTTEYRVFAPIYTKRTAINPSYCDKFIKYDSTWDIDKPYIYSTTAGLDACGEISVRLPNGVDPKVFFASNPVTIYYELPEYITIKLSEYLDMSLLNNTNDNIYVYTVNDNTQANPIINLNYERPYKLDAGIVVDYKVPFTLIDNGNNNYNVILDNDYYYGKSLTTIYNKLFKYARYTADSEQIDIPLGTNFRYCTNKNNYLVFVNSRVIGSDNFDVAVPGYYNPFDNVILYINIILKSGDIVDVFYLPFSVNDIYSRSNINYIQAENMFNLSEWIKTISFIYNGTITSDNNSFTLTSTGSSCYTNPYDYQDNGVHPLYYSVLPNSEYTLILNKKNNVGSVTIFYFNNKTHFTEFIDSNNNIISFTTPVSCNYISLRFGVYTAGLTETFSDIQIIKGVPNGDIEIEKSVIPFGLSKNNYWYFINGKKINPNDIENINDHRLSIKNNYKSTYNFNVKQFMNPVDIFSKLISNDDNWSDITRLLGKEINTFYQTALITNDETDIKADETDMKAVILEAFRQYYAKYNISESLIYDFNDILIDENDRDNLNNDIIHLLDANLFNRVDIDRTEV